jgi:hypothetical protein
MAVSSAGCRQAEDEVSPFRPARTWCYYALAVASVGVARVRGRDTIICVVSPREAIYWKDTVVLRAGAIVLSVVQGFNMLLAGYIIAMLLFVTDHPLISRIVFTEEELKQVGPKAVATIKDLAILMNSGGLTLSFLVLAIIWTSLIHGQQWAFWVLLIALGFTQVMMFLGDAAIGHKTLPASIVFTLANAVGLACCGWGLLARP